MLSEDFLFSGRTWYVVFTPSRLLHFDERGHSSSTSVLVGMLGPGGK